MNYQNILVETHDVVGLITLNRPDVLNALSDDLMDELSDAVDRLETDDAIGALVLTGSDKAFAAGADIKRMKDSDYMDVYMGNFIGRNWERISTCRKPVIAAVAGYALGGGCELAVATDLRIASDNSRMGIPVGKLGISIGHREMQGLVNLVGKGNALYILLSARLLDAQESLRIGLVNQVVKQDELREYTYKLAKDIASLAPLSHAVNKLTIRQVQNKPSLENLTQKEADLPLTQFDTKDYLEGYKAFLEKRRPNFIGE